jgi:hypothetical protein
MLSSKETAAQCADLKYPMYKLYSVGYEHKALNVKVKVPCVHKNEVCVKVVEICAQCCGLLLHEPEESSVPYSES